MKLNPFLSINKKRKHKDKLEDAQQHIVEEAHKMIFGYNDEENKEHNVEDNEGCNFQDNHS